MTQLFNYWEYNQRKLNLHIEEIPTPHAHTTVI